MRIGVLVSAVWLRSPNNNNSNNAWNVNNDGSLNNNNVNNTNNGVVPDLLLSKEKSQRVYCRHIHRVSGSKGIFPFPSHFVWREKLKPLMICYGIALTYVDLFLNGFFCCNLKGGDMTDWEKIISFESLYKAHRRARLGKRHKKEVILFESNLAENLWQLHYDLKYGRYEVSGYHKFLIHDPKEREIQAISYRDRIVQHSLCDNFLSPLLEKHLIYDNTACRKGKGTDFAIKRLRKFMLSHYKKYGRRGYFVKLDVKKYFPSIDHSLIKQKIQKIVTDSDILGLIFNIIDSYNADTGKGLPMGNQTSQCFALLYLDVLDRAFKEKMGVKRYVRYMDDIIAIVEDKNVARECFVGAKEIMEQNNLMINPKSQVIAFSNGIDFLGWRFFVALDGALVQKLRQGTKKRILVKARLLNYMVLIKRVSEKRPQLTIVSYYGFLRKGDAFYFFVKIEAVLGVVSL